MVWLSDMDFDSGGNIYLTGLNLNVDVFKTIKCSSGGKILWQKCWDNYTDGHPGEVITDTKGNIYVAGKPNSKNKGFTGLPEASYVILKFDTDGTFVWKIPYERSDVFLGRKWIDDDGNIYVVCRHREPDKSSTEENSIFMVGKNEYPVIFKYNDKGIKIWEAPYVEPDKFISLFQMTCDKKGNLYITGTSSIFSGNNIKQKIITLQYNRDGKILDKTCIPLPDNALHIPDSYVSDGKGNVYTLGDVSESVIDKFGLIHKDFFLLKQDQQGNRIWLNTFYEPDIQYLGPLKIVMDKQGNLYTSCCTKLHPFPYLAEPGKTTEEIFNEIPSNVKMITTKWNPDGKKLWTSTIEVPESCPLIHDPMKIFLDNKENLLIIKLVTDFKRTSDALVVKYNSEGQMLDKKRFDNITDFAKYISNHQSP